MPCTGRRTPSSGLVAHGHPAPRDPQVTPALPSGRAAWTLLLSAAAIWLAASACAQPTPSPTPPPTQTPAPTPTPSPTATPTVLEQLVGETGWLLFNVRLLDPGEPLSVRPVSGTVMRRLLDGHLSALGLRDTLEREQRLLAFIGLVPPGTDLYDLYLDLYAEQSPSLYSPDRNEIALVPSSDAIGVREALLMAYAYGFALQERHFGVSALRRDSLVGPDRRLALDALSVGDAAVSMTLYGVNRFPSVTAQDLTFLSESPALASAPFAVRQMFLFPFTFGSDFVLALQVADGWRGVDSAYGDPPQSTAQVLHPGRHLDGFTPARVTLPDLGAALGPGWALDSQGVLGEFLLRVYLGSALPGEVAAEAASGWAGDAYTLLAGPDVGLLAARTVWEDAGQARGFFDAYVDLTDARRGWSASGVGEDGAWWRAADAYVALGLEGEEVWVVLGPDEAAARRASALISQP